MGAAMEETKEKKLSIKAEGVPRIFREDLDSQLKKDVFDEIIRYSAENRQLNLKVLENTILTKGLMDTLVGLERQDENLSVPDIEETGSFPPETED